VVSIKDVEHAANLACLKLADNEKAAFTEKLNEIFAYMEQLRELDVSGVAPTTHVLDLKNVFRDDAVKPGLSREKALSNAPDEIDGCFAVPKIL
jgi:aspartyl-tRNA(Asn)/glutamyl-tRNA(Gln) amidotransferase subunit C